MHKYTVVLLWRAGMSPCTREFLFLREVTKDNKGGLSKNRTGMWTVGYKSVRHNVVCNIENRFCLEQDVHIGEEI